MQRVGDVEHARAAVITEFVSLGVLLGAAVPAVLIALTVDDLVGVLCGTFIEDLGDFVAAKQGFAHCAGRKIVCRRSGLLLFLLVWLVIRSWLTTHSACCLLLLFTLF